jgi:hypothetical protein
MRSSDRGWAPTGCHQKYLLSNSSERPCSNNSPIRKE